MHDASRCCHSVLTIHSHIAGRAIHVDSLRGRYPEDVIASYQDLAQCSGVFSVDVFLGAIELDVHVRIYTDQGALVFGLTPLKSYDDLFVNPAHTFISL